MRAAFANSALRHGYTQQAFYELLARDYLKIRSQRGLEDVYELLAGPSDCERGVIHHQVFFQRVPWYGMSEAASLLVSEQLGHSD
jgi:hypothetical protein